MKLTELEISNFRILGDISLSAGEVATVIVGPNASGKTTVLEAIRFLKAILAPRTSDEFQHVAQSLSAFDAKSFQLSTSQLLGDPKRPGRVRIKIELASEELDAIDRGAQTIALSRISRGVGSSSSHGQAMLTQFLSTSEGQSQLEELSGQVKESIESLKNDGGKIQPELLIDPGGTVRGNDPFAQECLAFLSRRLPYTQALVSYFPADRAMTTGQVNLQLGVGEVQAHMRSHLSQPQQKYNRLKQYVVSQRILGTAVEQHFNMIFSELLPGKELGRFFVADNGQLTIEIREPASSRTYDIDQMSSGEKGIVLTFLLMLRAVANGGLILLDEPELHLNPAICRKLLPYLIDKVLRPMGKQAIVCTHSPEILAEAYRREDTALLHLRSPRDLSPIRWKDKDEVFEAIQRLGSDPAATLFNQGVLFVEGPDDVMLIELGFQSEIEGFKLQKLGGRSELEKNSKKLKEAEKKGQLSVPHSFLLDNDRKPVKFDSTTMVRVVQLGRYCIENYLIDDYVVHDVAKGFLGRDCPSLGQVRAKIKDLAMEQIPYIVACGAYDEPGNPGLRPSEVRPLGAKYENIGEVLRGRLEEIVGEIEEMNLGSFVEQFVSKCTEIEKKIREEWDSNWGKLADGKLLLRALRNEFKLHVSEAELKRRLMVEGSRQKRPLWSELRDHVIQAVKEGH